MSGRGRSARTLDLLDATYDILSEIQPCSVRAVCYRLFTMSLIPSMDKTHTNKVSTLLRWAREEGHLPWQWITDETREPERVNAFANPDEYVDVVRRAYRRDRWQDQPAWVEVWSEKGTVRGTVWPVLETYGVTLRVLHGYGSATSLNDIASDTRQQRRHLTALYIGDWDPSGLHMSAVDLPRRLDKYGADADVVRLALDAADLTDDLPSFAADSKRADPRYAWFRLQHGSRCWELDALSPVVLRARVEQAIRDRIDWPAWHQADHAEQAELASLDAILSRWPTISGQATKYSRPGGTA